MLGWAAMAASKARSISRPVISLAWRMRRLEWPPSRPRSNSRAPLEISRSVNCIPKAINSEMRGGPSPMMTRNAALGIVGVGLGAVLFRHDGHPATLGDFQGERKTRDATPENHEVKNLGHLLNSPQRTGFVDGC